MSRALLLAASLFALAWGGGAPAAKPSADATCVRARAEARYRNLGYDHIVHLDSTCDRDADCDVSTDVSSTVHRVTAPARRSVEVVTFIGSPARVFTPKVTCELRRTPP
ncbi:MAG: hypothetical protein IT374_03455 [Polyangiaceae bacterium]|nr:hypothetical protein [Polyangiaceae bacterium]